MTEAQKRLTTMPQSPEEMAALMDSTDLHLLNEAALVFGGEAAEAARTAGVLEAERKRLHFEIRDELVRTTEKLSITRAEEEAKTRQEYIDYQTQIATLNGNAEAWRAAAHFLKTRIRILLAEKAETANVG